MTEHFEKTWRRIRHEYVKCENQEKVARMLLAQKETGIKLHEPQEGWLCQKYRSKNVTIELCLSEGGCARQIAGITARLQGRYPDER